MNRRRNNKSGIFFEPMNRLNLHRHFKNFDIFKIRLFSFQLRILNEIFLFLLRNFINRSERDRSTKKNSIKKKKKEKKNLTFTSNSNGETLEKNLSSIEMKNVCPPSKYLYTDSRIHPQGQGIRLKGTLPAEWNSFFF